MKLGDQKVMAKKSKESRVSTFIHGYEYVQGEERSRCISTMVAKEKEQERREDDHIQDELCAEV